MSSPADRHLEWYERVHVFSDRQRRLFTVVNVPYDLRLPSGPNQNIKENLTYWDMLRPQYATDTIPEAAFITRTIPVADALLSCLAADHVELELDGGGYRVPIAVQRSWLELERGLNTINGMLLQGINSPTLGTVTHYPSWSKPSEWNFRYLYPHYEAAQRVAHRTRASLLFLAARCSMFIAIWQHERPTTPGHPTPAWIAELEKRQLPSSWRDAIQESIVSDFSAGLRIGAVFEVDTCRWLQLIPVLRRSLVPIFFHWRSPRDAAFVHKYFPHLSDLIPAAERDRTMACQLPSPSHSNPPFYRLVHNGVARNHPDMTVTPHEVPRGPYQRPQESRQAFLTRRLDLSRKLQMREDSASLERRKQRERWASWQPLPRTLSGIYVWTSVGQAYPHYPEKWHTLEIRVAVPNHAVLGLWRTIPERARSYNSFFDEWDLWFPDKRDQGQDNIISAALHDSAPSSLQALPYPQTPMTNARELPSLESQTTLPDLEELESLPLPASTIHTPSLNLNDIMLWYGVHPTARLFDDVDYDTYLNRVCFIFGQSSSTLTQDPLLLRSLSGWVWSMASNQLDSRALAETWDLDDRSSHFLLNHINSGLVRLHEYAWLETGYERVLYDLTFHDDPQDMPWRLLVGAAAAVFLIRHPDITNSQVAVKTLLIYGISFHTVAMSSSLGRQPTKSVSLRSRHITPYRHQSFRPTTHDYHDYVKRVLDIVRQPHTAAGFRMGGIIWRILMEVVKDDEDFQHRLIEQAGKGPSDETSIHEEILQLSPSFTFADDCLSEQELDVISGVYKVYTNQLNQTADVSWWPKHKHWINHAGQYTGIWTQWNEKWFSDRLKSIYDGTACPKTSHEWKQALKGHREIKTVGNLVESASKDFIRARLL